MIYFIKYKTRDGFCKFDHNGECLTCDCWASDCAFVRMQNEDYKYETAEDFERIFGIQKVERSVFFKELQSFISTASDITLIEEPIGGIDRWALCKNEVDVEDPLHYQKLDKLQIPNTRIVFENSKTRFEILSYENL